MVTQVTCFKANDGTLFDTVEEAQQYETKVVIGEYAQSILNRIITSTDKVDKKHAKENMVSMFSNKNTRNIIREMLDLCAEPGND